MADYTVGKKWIEWRELVIARDQCCQFCLTTKDLVAHHVHLRKEYPELLYVQENGLTLCNSCHSRYHNLGKKLTESAKKKIGEIHKGNRYRFGKNHTDEAKRKMSMSGKVKIFSVEHKQKLSAAQKGNQSRLGTKHTEETRLKMSETRKGRKHSEETRSKMREVWNDRKLKGQL